MTNVMNGAIPPATIDERMAGKRRQMMCRLDNREKRSRMDGVGDDTLVSGIGAVL